MDGKFDLFTLLTLLVAVVAIWKLRSVLGQRTGDEDTRVEQRRRDAQERQAARPAQGGDNIVAIPRRDARTPAVSENLPAVATAVEARIKTVAGEDAPLAKGLMDIARLDRSFDPDQFLNGAKQAYEMIVTAFAEGNRKLLRTLITREVADEFERALHEREQQGVQTDQTFIGIDKADIVGADLKGGTANVTVRFDSQLITATRDKAGKVLSGDPNQIKKVVDIWTFTRDISTPDARKDPNWRLVETVAPN